ncbi:Antisigma-factor antagonist [Candidatus Magnetomorum sp. HK-1]|nr:Antisigma-factor antagonist [Candidatus Magnetomorum sp. HK-1]
MKNSQNKAIEFIKISDEDGIKIVFPQKDLVDEISIGLCQIFDELLTSGHSKFKIDFSKVNKIDTIGVGAIILLKRKTLEGGEMSLIKMNAKINNFFSLILKK